MWLARDQAAVRSYSDAYWWPATQLCINHPELQQTPQVKGKVGNKIAPT